VLRFVFIYLGVSLIQKWTFILPAFGAILIFTGTKMLRTSENGSPQPENSRVLALLRKVFHVTPSLHGHSFFTRIQGRLHATPLFASLVLVEASDLVFAADSIPAALAVTSDLFLVYTSNIFAVMGLRSLYFLLEGSMQEFRYLKTGVSITLLYIGAKLLAHPWVAIPAGWSLFVICAVLTTSLAASLRAQAKKN
jgi:tellurite resistance protein TerC